MTFGTLRETKGLSQMAPYVVLPHLVGSVVNFSFQSGEKSEAQTRRRFTQTFFIASLYLTSLHQWHWITKHTWEQNKFSFLLV